MHRKPYDSIVWVCRISSLDLFSLDYLYRIDCVSSSHTHTSVVILCKNNLGKSIIPTALLLYSMDDNMNKKIDRNVDMTLFRSLIFFRHYILLYSNSFHQIYSIPCNFLLFSSTIFSYFSLTESVSSSYQHFFIRLTDPRPSETITLT